MNKLRVAALGFACLSLSSAAWAAKPAAKNPEPGLQGEDLCFGPGQGLGVWNFRVPCWAGSAGASANW